MFAIVGSLIAGSFVGYKLHNQIVEVLMRPIDGLPLYFSNPAGGFEFLLKVSMTFGLLLALPVVCYNVIKFLEPVMNRPSKRFVSLLVISSIVLALGGATFAYYISLPAALNFLMGASVASVEPLLSTQEYFSFVLIYLAGFAALFQVPLVLVIINRITPLKPMKLLKNQRFVILISFIVAAILTPTPDPVNQTIMAAPAIVMYQFGVMAVAITNRRPRRLGQQNKLIPEITPEVFNQLKPEIVAVTSRPRPSSVSSRTLQSLSMPAAASSRLETPKIKVPKRAGVDGIALGRGAPRSASVPQQVTVRQSQRVSEPIHLPPQTVVQLG